MALRLSEISHHFDRPARRAQRGLAQPRPGALNAVSLEVAAGEILTVFGPSGCGKTTLLRLVAGHEALQTGSITLDGQTLSSPDAMVPPEERPIGFVFQDYVLFPHLTVAQNIRFGLRDLPVPVQQARLAAQLDQLGLADFANRFPHELSGGQQQRVAIARALARNPKVLLLDEPFASLGMVLRQRLQAELRSILKNNGVTVLFVTHDPGEAIMMGDRLALLSAGSLRDVGTPQSLYEAPSALVSAALFPERQKITGMIDADGVHTALGHFNGDAPVRAALRPKWEQAMAISGSADLIISTDHITPTLAPGGAFVVTECRFAAPGWRVFLAPMATGPAHKNSTRQSVGTSIAFLSKTAFDTGVRLDCALSADGIVWIEPRP
ncbi:MAG: ABC transporter ATP-binding protein [Pseudomonadota bacterium]